MTRRAAEDMERELKGKYTGEAKWPCQKITNQTKPSKDQSKMVYSIDNHKSRELPDSRGAVSFSSFFTLSQRIQMHKR